MLLLLCGTHCLFVATKTRSGVKMKEQLVAEDTPHVLTGLARLHQMAEPRTVASPRRRGLFFYYDYEPESHRRRPSGLTLTALSR